MVTCVGGGVVGMYYLLGQILGLSSTEDRCQLGFENIKGGGETGVLGMARSQGGAMESLNCSSMATSSEPRGISHTITALRQPDKHENLCFSTVKPVRGSMNNGRTFKCQSSSANSA